ncbi:MAG: enoyl-CoA hydratase/isomerase family protein [Silicimonas sp.]|nr:enoyl-CoA hydratase/isomerase family protein [Silicimonas sp.]
MSVELTLAGDLAELRLNRPAKLNALTAEMVADLQAYCRTIEHSDARVVLLTAAGKSFCAGGDIEAWADRTPEAFGRFWVREGHAALDALARLRQPVIALLEGHTLGGGLELAACADLRIAEAHVKLGQPETGLGIIPGWSGTQRAVRRFGAQAARRMALMGEVFEAEEAKALGLVDQVVPTGQGRSAAQAAVARVTARGARASELTKMMINAAEGEETGRVIESLAGALAAGTEELAQGLEKFRAKKAPECGGKT